jgi:phosphate starvation-inducible protein PhoH and related proteins
LSNKGKAKKKAARSASPALTTETEKVTSVKTPEQKKKLLAELLNGRMKVEPKTSNQAKFIKAINDSGKQIVIGSGIAGTGKTFLALSSALNLLKGKNDYTEIIIYKSVAQLKGEEQGYLPGDQKDKLAYTYLSYYDQIKRLISKESFEKMVEMEFIKIYPLGSIRGMSMSPNRIVIVDEFQNLSIDNGHTVVTRMEEGSKLIITGDIYQRDRANKSDNALQYMTTHYKGVDKSIGIVEFTKDDVVRSPLIKRLQEIYEEHGLK